MEYNSCIIVPIYTTNLTDIEKLSLKRCLEILHKHHIKIVKPVNLNIESIYIDFNMKDYNIEIKNFDDNFFYNIDSYNKLMLSNIFYKTFIKYKYILIYQLDCYVFKDNLDYWCKQNYDYIGAPWLSTPINSFFNKFNRLFKKDNSREAIFFKVGNGGFSLRNVNKFNEITEKYEKEIKSYEKNEDVFWSIEVPKLIKNFRIPSYTEAVYFCIDRKPKIGFELTNKTLPFGAHGINKKKVIKFWKKIIGF